MRQHTREQTSLGSFLQYVHTHRGLPFATEGTFAAGFGPLSDRLHGLPHFAIHEGPKNAQILELYTHSHGDKSARLYFSTEKGHEGEHVPTLVVGQVKPLERLAKREGVCVLQLPDEGVVYEGEHGEVIRAEDVRNMSVLQQFFGDKQPLYYAFRKSTFVLTALSVMSLPDRRMLRVSVFRNQLGKPDEFSALIHNVDPDVPLFTTSDGQDVHTVNVTNAHAIRRNRNLAWEEVS
jgi:hypothetical protein